MKRHAAKTPPATCLTATGTTSPSFGLRPACGRPAAGDARIYIDGSLAALSLIQDNNTEPQDIDNTQPWRFGNNNSGSFFLDGLIDEVAMWNSELTASNIEWLAINTINPNAVFVPEPSTILLLALGMLGMVRRRSRRN